MNEETKNNITQKLIRAVGAYAAQIAHDTVLAQTGIWSKEELALEMKDTLRDLRSLVKEIFDTHEVIDPLGVRAYFLLLDNLDRRLLGMIDYAITSNDHIWLLPAHLYYVLKGEYGGMYVTGIDGFETRISDSSEEMSEGHAGYGFM